MVGERPAASFGKQWVSPREEPQTIKSRALLVARITVMGDQVPDLYAARGGGGGSPSKGLSNFECYQDADHATADEELAKQQ